MTIIIAAKRSGFRRCGVAHSSQPTFYRDDHFTEGQLNALAKDPQLVVSYADADLVDLQEQADDINSQSSLSKASLPADSTLPQVGETDPSLVVNAPAGIDSGLLGGSDSGSGDKGANTAGTDGVNTLGGADSLVKVPPAQSAAPATEQQEAAPPAKEEKAKAAKVAKEPAK